MKELNNKIPALASLVNLSVLMESIPKTMMNDTQNDHSILLLSIHAITLLGTLILI